MTSKGIAPTVIIGILVGVVVVGAVAFYYLLTSGEGAPRMSRIHLRLEATHVTLSFAETPSNEEINNLIEDLEEGLNTSIVSLMPYEEVQTHNQIVLEIGKIVTDNMISTLIGETIEIQSIEEKISNHTREAVIDALYTRVDPYGTLGAQVKSIGANFVLVEAPLPLDRMRELLVHQGRFEIFIENELVLRSEHLKDVDSPRYSRERMRYEVPFELTDEGAERFADASENKGGYPGVIYLDRPDAILLFEEGFTDQISTDAGPDIGRAEYDESARMFRFQTLGDGEAHWFYVQVDAVEIQVDNIPLETLEYLRVQQGMKRRVIFLGKLDDLSENMIQGENLVWDNEVLFIIEEETKLEGEFTTEWLARVAGAKSWPIISEEIAGDVDKIKAGLVITTASEEDARNIYTILSQRLPVEISIESEVEI